MRNSKTRKHFILITCLAWTAVHLYLSHQRGAWVDEWWRFRQMNFGLFAALKDLFIEISPFGPGEILLGKLAQLILSPFSIPELWGRIPSLIFGALTVWLALTSGQRFLILPTLFSVSLTTFSTQFRPYAALIFGGALAFRMIWDNRPLSRFEKILAWFNAFFGHVYGMCFVAFASFLRRWWIHVVGTAVYIVLIFIARELVGATTSRGASAADFAPFFTTVKQILGTLTNPHKASYVVAPLAAYGLFRACQRDKSALWKAAVFFGMTIVGPIVATVIAKYYFLPRQVVGALFGVLWLAAIGLEDIAERLRRARLPVALAWVLNIAVSVGPWAAFVAGVPPFVDQPLHKFRQIAERSVAMGAKNVLWTDPGTSQSADIYFERVLGKPIVTAQSQTIAGVQTAKSCWKQGLCIYFMNDVAATWDKSRLIAPDSPMLKILSSSDIKFDVLVYSADYPPSSFPLKTDALVMRIW